MERRRINSTHDKGLIAESRMRGKSHVRFGIGGEEGDFLFDP